MRNDTDNLRASIATLTLAGLFAVSVVMLLAGYALDVAGLRLAGVLGAFFFGVGAAPLRIFRRSGLVVRLALAVLAGTAVPALLAGIMVFGPLWHPWVAAFLLGAAAVTVHVRASREAIARLRASGRRLVPAVDRSSYLNLSTGLTAAGCFWWLASMAAAGHIDPGIGGFLTRISPMWYVGVLLVLGGIVLARGRGEAAAIFGTVSLVAALTVTPAVVYGLPRIQSAAKHVGFVQLILDSHHLDRHIGIYQAYSGFFAFNGWLCDIAGVKDALGLAAYWPAIIDIAALAVLRLFFGVLLRSTYRVYLALALTFLVDVVGQDYFSPQSAGFVLVFGVYALALGGDEVKLSRRTRIGLIAVISCELAVMHQFSPFIAAVVLGAFVIAKIMRPVYIPLIAAGPAVLWALLNWSVLGHFISLSDLGNLSNFAPPKTVATPGLQRLPIVGQGSHALLAGLLVLMCLAAAGFWAAVTRRPGWGFLTPRYAWAMVISSGSGLILVAANPYGNEGIFRAALFAIPWLAALAVTAVPRARPERAKPNWVPPALAALLTGLTATYCLSTFALDNASVIRPGDVNAVVHNDMRTSSSGYILNLSYGDASVGLVLPATGHSVEWTKVVPQSGGHAAPMTSDSAALLARNYLAYVAKDHGQPGKLYAIWTPVSVNYAIDYGLETARTAVAWLSALSDSPAWKLVYSQDGTYLFQLVANES